MGLSLLVLGIGIGIGFSMQILTIIVQSVVPYRDLGVATSAVTFFRTLGSSFGAAVFGTVYSNVLANRVAAYADAIHLIFLLAVPVAVVAFVLALTLKEVPLRDTARSAAADVRIPAAVLRPAFDAAVEVFVLRARCWLAGQLDDWDVGDDDLNAALDRMAISVIEDQRPDCLQLSSTSAGPGGAAQP